VNLSSFGIWGDNIRIFIQEFFQVYPEHGRFDWSRLDRYMDALAKTGAC
jgi:hypothetical protein